MPLPCPASPAPTSSESLMKDNYSKTQRGWLVRLRDRLWCWVNSQKGQTIIEILIAIAVGALVLTAITATATITVSNADFAKKKTEAVKYLEEGVENVRIARDNAISWELFKLNYPLTDIPATGFNRITTVEPDPNEPLNEDRRQVTVTVSWEDAKGTHEVMSTTILSNWVQ